MYTLTWLLLLLLLLRAASYRYASETLPWNENGASDRNLPRKLRIAT
jgi:hypothetical protein